MDRAGHIYITNPLAPPGAKVPEHLRDIPAAAGWFGAKGTGAYGTLFKFQPTGGSFKVKTVGEAEGALWSYYGTGYMLNTDGYCMCLCARGDMDQFGRWFLPDNSAYCVAVVDSAGNLVRRIDFAYGNPDDQPFGQDGVTIVPFREPHHVAVSSEALYVGDSLNGRVARFTMAYKALAVAETPR